MHTFFKIALSVLVIGAAGYGSTFLNNKPIHQTQPMVSQPHDMAEAYDPCKNKYRIEGIKQCFTSEAEFMLRAQAEQVQREKREAEEGAKGVLIGESRAYGSNAADEVDIEPMKARMAEAASNGNFRLELQRTAIHRPGPDWNEPVRISQYGMGVVMTIGGTTDPRYHFQQGYANRLAHRLGVKVTVEHTCNQYNKKDLTDCEAKIIAKW